MFFFYRVLLTLPIASASGRLLWHFYRVHNIFRASQLGWRLNTPGIPARSVMQMHYSDKHAEGCFTSYISIQHCTSSPT